MQGSSCETTLKPIIMDLDSVNLVSVPMWRALMKRFLCLPVVQEPVEVEVEG